MMGLLQGLAVLVVAWGFIFDNSDALWGGITWFIILCVIQGIIWVAMHFVAKAVKLGD